MLRLRAAWWVGLALVGARCDLVRAQSEGLSVKAFGAVCDGATDDAEALKRAFTAAAATGETLHFPAKATCLVARDVSINDAVIFLRGNGESVLKVEGNGATLLDTVTPTSEHRGQLTLGTEGSWSSIEIANLNFTSRHKLNAYDVAGLGVGSGNGDVIERFVVSGGVFTNHTSAISVNGARHTLISHNVFYQTNRDYGTLSGHPDQAIRVGSNTAAPTYDTEVAFNTYHGCTAEANLRASVSHRCGDGLVIGLSRGWKVHDNTIDNFSFEGIFLVTRATTAAGAPRYPAAIYHNRVDATLIADQHPNSYSIRCDEPRCDVYDNQLLGTVQGILVDGRDTGIPGLTVPNVHLHDNTISMSEKVPFAQEGGAGTQYGILTQNAIEPVIERNRIVWASRHEDGNTPTVSGITLGAGTVDPVVNGNTVDGGKAGATRTALHAYEFFHRGTAALDGSNAAMGAEVGVFAGGAESAVRAPGFVFKGTTTAVKGANVSVGSAGVGVKP